jgi:hypothetical protein
MSRGRYSPYSPVVGWLRKSRKRSLYIVAVPVS